ncbi:hypothetical protein NYR55_13410 [Sphingomonas sp. BGYR3]|uniref:hypothetical protein n=1 Tax=Sphingomonas sp. BGYR3 TaxID=2975483 RepID=UPI0021A6A58A|nr:hypothetical protein [Sphingomonas sp. BGYR3]MDG5489615.1 hypothetical protein [Sphingomonas sp. BGYR3]
MRVWIELAFVALGLIAALGIGWLSAWSYPQGAGDIWLVTGAAMLISAAMGVRPVMRALAQDRAGRGHHG